MNRVETFEVLMDRTQDLLDTQEQKDPIPAVDLYNLLPDFWDEWFNPFLKAWSPQARRDLCGFWLEQMKLHGEVCGALFRGRQMFIQKLR